MDSLKLSRYALSACAAAILLAGCGGSATGFSPNAQPGPETRTFTPRHLYAAQSGFYRASKVYRFRLDANGLPGKTPDGVLILSARNPGSIAIGPEGDLYVSSAGTPSGCKTKCFVEVFAPGASFHAKPIRVLYVPQQPLYVAVDQQGYLDVSTLRNRGTMTNVYAPDARGHDRPINRLATDVVNALGASNGNAYIETLLQVVEGVAEHSRSSGPVFYTFRRSNYASNGVATEGGNLYAQVAKLIGSEFFLATAVYRTDRPGLPIREIIGTGCMNSRSGGALGYGLAAYKNCIYQGCITVGGNKGSVFVYDSTKDGKQAPVERLSGGATGVAIGP
jgi:hypothetical protein